jgi:hypothetical protein
VTVQIHPARTPEGTVSLVDLDEIVIVDAVPARIGDMTWPHGAPYGYGHMAIYKANGREQLPGDWRWTPQTCLAAGGGQGIWIDPEHLACPGCGLDCT